MLDIRNRITELIRCLPADIDDHPHQWKIHTAQQREVLSGLLTEIGITDALLVWPSARNGGRLTAFDGHLRKSLDPDLAWPTLVTDLTDAEADVMLLAVDPLTQLVQTDLPALDTALRQAHSSHAAVMQFLSELAKKEGLYQPAPDSLETLEGAYGEPDEEAFWPVITLKVPPEVHEHYQALMDACPGASDAERFAALLDRLE